MSDISQVLEQFDMLMYRQVITGSEFNSVVDNFITMWHIGFFQIDENNEKRVKKYHQGQHTDPYVLDHCMRNRVRAARRLQRYCRHLHLNIQQGFKKNCHRQPL